MNVGQMRYVSSPCRAALCRLLLSCSKAVTCCFAFCKGCGRTHPVPVSKPQQLFFPDRSRAFSTLLQVCSGNADRHLQSHLLAQIFAVLVSD